MNRHLRAFPIKALLTGVACAGVIWPAGALAGSVLYGHAGFYTVKGQPGTFTGLHEWKLHLSADGGAIDGLYEHVATTSGAYNFTNIAGNDPVPAGSYSVYLDRANVWGRPTVIYNITMPSSGSVYRVLGPPTDYHAFFNGGDYDVWGSSPWEWGTTWYQTFTAAGMSVTGITVKFVGVTATSVRLSIVRDNGGNITTWPTVGQTRTRPAGNGDVWARFLSNEVPTVPGLRYALKIEGIGGGGRSACTAEPRRGRALLGDRLTTPPGIPGTWTFARSWPATTMGPSSLMPCRCQRG